ncbi:RagB/SusD family nutrient uptake outer membrane protein [Mariniphaga sediminis]|jgi:hypothetical protein|uniref:RagB/SusD family nutrient uptake outer membrane protein n=1 Tax=Mariniphaga sediminis TaxID=1628158 RepID=A0A399CZR6_9BACT|nr:RagB/SusD family nutrient uptake outer membrane protein [Mariniphaga sediminis]RIH63580.1 RagB/SusD family nutrient uptake outer membrane protein [Mariniphaga sediminis]
MKTNKKYKIFIVLLMVFFTSCNEADFLKEEAKDFLTPSNAYVTNNDFQTSLNYLYTIVRERYYGRESNYSHMMMMRNGTDMWYDARVSSGISRWGHYDVNMATDSRVPLNEWRDWYKLISEVNTIIASIDGSELSEDEANQVEAEARFFRGFAYRHLVYLFGGVPLITEQITSPETDFTRATKDQILTQIIDDLEYASANLPELNEVSQDGRISNLVALHYLAETYISEGEDDKAITALTTVIDNPNTALMKERFGSRKSREPGDVYWDLFRRGNQNRSAGNIEAIWVAQMETDLPGGFLVTTATTYNHAFERFFIPAIWTLNDPDGILGVRGYEGDDNVGSAGVSLAMPTDYLINQIWESDFNNDIRNAPHNIVRDFIYSNPESAYYGKSGLEYPGSVILAQDWRWYPWFVKATTPENHPDELYIDKSNYVLSSFAGSTYRESYILRLAECYLLRAEAYLNKGLKDKAADDINEVRQRANATPVNAGDVTIEYILDERARELVLETPRRLTLMRLGLLISRVKEYNFWNADDIQDHHSLWPIPNSEIEANINANLEQNPGY